MKISILYAAMAGFDHGLSGIVKKATEVFEELGVRLNEINLSFTQIPFYDGVQSNSIEAITKELSASDGIVFATTAQLFSPCSVMQNFLEHLEHPSYSQILKEKNCMLLVVSRQSGEREALDYLARVVNYLGGYDSVRIAIGGKVQKMLSLSEKPIGVIEKQIEDFYRIVKLDRKFFLPSASSVTANQISEPFTDEEYETILQVDKRAKVSTAELQQRVNFDNFTKRQEDDINEISQLFASKYTAQAPTVEEFIAIPRSPASSFSAPGQPIVARTKSCKQMTQSLPHYFQPHLSAGYNFTVQLSISGAEIFDGFITIENNDCVYHEGITNAPDITILTDSNVWVDILRGKHTAQKAFMIGQLKVRGNFVMLSKFEQLFKKM